MKSTKEPTSFSCDSKNGNNQHFVEYFYQSEGHEMGYA